jgi:hypothetical protein
MTKRTYDKTHGVQVDRQLMNRAMTLWPMATHCRLAEHALKELIERREVDAKYAKAI